MTSTDPLADVADHVDEQLPDDPPLDELAGDALRNADVLDPQLVDLDVDDLDPVEPPIFPSGAVPADLENGNLPVAGGAA